MSANWDNEERNWSRGVEYYDYFEDTTNIWKCPWYLWVFSWLDLKIVKFDKV